MSHNLENNKIMASLLVAGIVAMLAGFVANVLVHPHMPSETILDIDTSALESPTVGGGPIGPEPVLALLADAVVARGEALSKACLACHSFDKGGAQKIGPNLWDIVNAKKAHVAGFAYSDVIKEMAAKGETWTYQNLNAFLWKPMTYAKGTKMSYPGLRKPDDRAAVIVYLRSLSDSQAALPSADAIAAEAPQEDDTLEKVQEDAADTQDAAEEQAQEESVPGATE